jgi:anti-sigma factor ChrR (cupin superfamily)
MRICLCAASLAIVCALTLAVAIRGNPRASHDQPSEIELFAVDQIKWKPGPPSLPKRAMFAVLEGDPTKEGPFVFRVKLPDGYRVPPHTHAKTERVTVISGTFNIGMGDKFDER